MPSELAMRAAKNVSGAFPDHPNGFDVKPALAIAAAIIDAEIAPLLAEIERLKVQASINRSFELQDENTALRHRVAELTRDAERYRFIEAKIQFGLCGEVDGVPEWQAFIGHEFVGSDPNFGDGIDAALASENGGAE